MVSKKLCKINYKDVFHSYLIRNATFSSDMEIPRIKSCREIPNKLILFSEALKTKDYDQWVMFYEHDYRFTRIWNKPYVYLKVLKKFNGVISPDFSLYRNMPLAMQLWSTFQGKALATWWQYNGIQVIPNVRFADKRSYAFCFAGIKKNSTIAIGTHGCIKKQVDRKYFIDGLKRAVEVLSPKNIIVYGAAPESIFKQYKDIGINIIHFSPSFYTSLQEKKVLY